MLREIGKRLVTGNAIDTPDDVFWLTLDELQEAATALDAGQQLADYRTLINRQRAIWESERALTPPVALPLKGGARFLGIDWSAWMPLFALASGVVTDVGGPLSHSSIVAREYHIPAVLGTGVATERLRSGQRITVDGDAGLVSPEGSRV